MIKAVIFDMDGTLLDTLEDLKVSTNFALKSLNFPERSLDEVRQFVGNGVRKLIERAVPKDCDENSIQKCIRIFKEHYSKNMYNNTKPYDGIIELLKSLKTSGIKIGVVSNKFDCAVKELSEIYFKNLIDVSIGQSESIPPKPNPKGIFKVMQELNSDKNSTIYSGDSDVDVLTAHNAQIPCIGVRWGFQDYKNIQNADYIINKPMEIIDIIKTV